MFGREKINDPYNTMGSAGKARPRKPEIRESQIRKLHRAHLKWNITLSNSPEGKRAKALLDAVIRNSSPDELSVWQEKEYRR
jgi:hypothetical protein